MKSAAGLAPGNTDLTGEQGYSENFSPTKYKQLSQRKSEQLEKPIEAIVYYVHNLKNKDTGDKNY